MSKTAEIFKLFFYCVGKLLKTDQNRALATLLVFRTKKILEYKEYV